MFTTSSTTILLAPLRGDSGINVFLYTCHQKTRLTVSCRSQTKQTRGGISHLCLIRQIRFTFIFSLTDVSVTIKSVSKSIVFVAVFISFLHGFIGVTSICAYSWKNKLGQHRNSHSVEMCHLDTQKNSLTEEFTSFKSFLLITYF